MEFTHDYNWAGDWCSCTNFDRKGNVLPYDTIGSWELYAYPRNMTYHNPMQPELSDEKYSYRWDVSFITGENTCEGIADGYADSLEACEQAFLELWSEIRKYKTCIGACNSKKKLNHVGTPYAF